MGRFRAVITSSRWASHSIINSKIVKAKFDTLVGAWFRKATSDEAPIKGKITRNNSISDGSMKHEFVIADIMVPRGNIEDGFYGKAWLRVRYEKASVTTRKRNFAIDCGIRQTCRSVQVVVQRQEKILPKSEAIVRATATQEIRLTQRQKVEYVVNHQVEIPKTCSKLSPEAEIFIQRWTSNLEEQQKRYAKRFLLENWSVFARVTSSGGRTNIAKHMPPQLNTANTIEKITTVTVHQKISSFFLLLYTKLKELRSEGFTLVRNPSTVVEAYQRNNLNGN
uniref:Uncharacterized protein n=1 Tax=Glossina pallidipes TaxID=7398 RepID=A0A1A9ZWM9_GLOPL